jgi:hypothetical protein
MNAATRRKVQVIEQYLNIHAPATFHCHARGYHSTLRIKASCTGVVPQHPLEECEHLEQSITSALARKFADLVYG